MCIGAAGDDAEAFARKSVGEHLRVGHDPTRVIMELRLHRLTETNRLCGNDVDQRTALHPGKYSLVDCSGKFLPAKNHAGARTTKCLMSRRSDNLGMRDR